MGFRLRDCLLAVGLLGCLPAFAGAEELVTAERNFAAAVAAEGVRAGFGKFMAGDGVLFRPRPVSVSEFLARPENPGLLEWVPAYARVSRSGDLGFTTGPWQYHTERTNSTIQATGQFFTVWRHTADGWLVAFDAGIGSPAMVFPGEAVTDGRNDPDEPLPSWRQTQRGQDLKLVEESFSRRSARDGESAALDAFGHKRVRVMRQGALPVFGRAEGVRFLASNKHRTRDVLQGAQVSGSGDLGYAWGESEVIGDAQNTTVRSWLRVWERSGWSGTWRIAVDLAAEYPPASVENQSP